MADVDSTRATVDELIKALSAKKPVEWDDPETRLREFQQAFGEDLRKLDAELTRYMQRLR